MQIDILINGRPYRTAAYDEAADEWQQGDFGLTGAMASAFQTIRQDVLQNSRWIYGKDEPRTVRELRPSGMTDETARLIESHLDALARLVGIAVADFCRPNWEEQVRDIISEHDAAQEAIRNPNPE